MVVGVVVAGEWVLLVPIDGRDSLAGLVKGRVTWRLPGRSWTYTVGSVVVRIAMAVIAWSLGLSAAALAPVCCCATAWRLSKRLPVRAVKSSIVPSAVLPVVSIGAPGLVSEGLSLSIALNSL